METALSFIVKLFKIIEGDVLLVNLTNKIFHYSTFINRFTKLVK